jgi:hypothetical protein
MDLQRWKNLRWKRFWFGFFFVNLYALFFYVAFRFLPNPFVFLWLLMCLQYLSRSLCYFVFGYPLFLLLFPDLRELVSFEQELGGREPYGRKLAFGDLGFGVLWLGFAVFWFSLGKHETYSDIFSTSWAVSFWLILTGVFVLLEWWDRRKIRRLIQAKVGGGQHVNGKNQ